VCGNGWGAGRETSRACLRGCAFSACVVGGMGKEGKLVVKLAVHLFEKAGCLFCVRCVWQRLGSWS